MQPHAILITNWPLLFSLYCQWYWEQLSIGHTDINISDLEWHWRSFRTHSSL